MDLKTEDFYLFDQINVVKCVVAAFPQPDISWEFKNGDFSDFETVCSRSVKNAANIITYFVDSRKSP